MEDSAEHCDSKVLRSLSLVGSRSVKAIEGTARSPHTTQQFTNRVSKREAFCHPQGELLSLTIRNLAQNINNSTNISVMWRAAVSLRTRLLAEVFE